MKPLYKRRRNRTQSTGENAKNETIQYEVNGDKILLTGENDKIKKICREVEKQLVRFRSQTFFFMDSIGCCCR